MTIESAVDACGALRHRLTGAFAGGTRWLARPRPFAARSPSSPDDPRGSPVRRAVPRPRPGRYTNTSRFKGSISHPSEVPLAMYSAILSCSAGRRSAGERSSTTKRTSPSDGRMSARSKPAPFAAGSPTTPSPAAHSSARSNMSLHSPAATGNRTIGSRGKRSRHEMR